MHPRPDAPHGALLEEYVRVRITDLTGVDLGLFEFDGHNAVYYFVLNAEEQIYLRYGGRDARGPDRYLDLESFALALELGLAEHAAWQRGERPGPPRPAPRFPRDVPLVQERIITPGRCVECHIVADYALQASEREGPGERVRTMFRCPDILRLGLALDVPRGLVLAQATGPAAEAGLQPGDLIRRFAGRRVLTFADLQHVYDRVPRDAETVELEALRGEETLAFRVELPPDWWASDLFHRYWSVEPLVYFANRALTPAEKEQLGLDPDGFASELTEVRPGARSLGVHALEVGDILFAVDGATSDPLTHDLRLHIKLRKVAGDTLELRLLRDGEPRTERFASERWTYRKESE